MNYVIFPGLCQTLIARLLLPAARARRPARGWLRWLLVCIGRYLTISTNDQSIATYTVTRPGIILQGGASALPATALPAYHPFAATPLSDGYA